MLLELRFSNYSIEAEVFPTATGEAILQALPFESRVMTWGDEIYFHVPAQAELEAGAKAEVEVGDLAYWPTMPAFCVFFGRTPVSIGEEPVAANPVNVFGKLKEVDLDALRAIADGERVTIIKKA